MEERLKMLSQQSIDAMNAEANDDNYEIASVGVSYERKVSNFYNKTSLINIYISVKN